MIDSDVYDVAKPAKDGVAHHVELLNTATGGPVLVDPLPGKPPAFAGAKSQALTAERYAAWAAQFAIAPDNGSPSTLQVIDNALVSDPPLVTGSFFVTTDSDPDTEFLTRALTDVRGNGPTALELKYFTEDRDPKKREKLIETLLKEPAVQKKLGNEWKAKVLAAPPAVKSTATTVEMYYFLTARGKDQELLFAPYLDLQRGKTPALPLPPTAPAPKATTAPKAPPVPQGPAVLMVTGPKAAAPPADRLEKLVGELIAAKKSDEGLLEAITLATLSRLPTDPEKRLALAAASSASDRKAAWLAVARALAGPEAKRSTTIELRMSSEPPAPPVPPAKP